MTKVKFVWELRVLVKLTDRLGWKDGRAPYLRRVPFGGAVFTSLDLSTKVVRGN